MSRGSPPSDVHRNIGTSHRGERVALSKGWTNSVLSNTEEAPAHGLYEKGNGAIAYFVASEVSVGSWLGRDATSVRLRNLREPAFPQDRLSIGRVSSPSFLPRLSSHRFGIGAVSVRYRHDTRTRIPCSLLSVVVSPSVVSTLHAIHHFTLSRRSPRTIPSDGASRASRSRGSRLWSAPLPSGEQLFGRKRNAVGTEDSTRVARRAMGSRLGVNVARSPVSGSRARKPCYADVTTRVYTVGTRVHARSLCPLAAHRARTQQHERRSTCV